MILTPLASWLLLGLAAAFTVALMAVWIAADRRTARRFYARQAEHDDPDYIARREAVYRRMHEQPHVYYQNGTNHD